MNDNSPFDKKYATGTETKADIQPQQLAIEIVPQIETESPRVEVTTSTVPQSFSSDIFDKEYATGTETKADTQSRQVPTEIVPKIETEKYGNGKPKRIITRSKIAND